MNICGSLERPIAFNQLLAVYRNRGNLGNVKFQVTFIKHPISLESISRACELFKNCEVIFYIGQSDEDTKLFGTKAYSYFKANLNGSNNNFQSSQFLTESEERVVCLYKPKIEESCIANNFLAILSQWEESGRKNEHQITVNS